MLKVFRISTLILFWLTVSISGYSNNSPSEKQGESTVEKFNASKLIMEHIADSYEWHIATIGNFHLSLPLPVLVYSQQSGFHCFSSSKFHHGQESYQGFQIGAEGSKYAGKIIETGKDGSEVRPIDISITKNVASLFTSIVILLVIFLSIAKRYKEGFDRAPKGLQSWIEPIVLFIRDDVVKASIGEEKYLRYLPYLLTVFFFILLNNLMGLVPILPGGANLTGNIAVTMILALFTFATISFSGTKDYYMHIVNAPGIPWWLKLPVPLMPIVEIMGVFTKPFVLMVRLFANITAGHIIALGFYSLIFIFGEKSVYAGYGVSVVSILFTIFMGLLELLVAFIQAYVFTLLSALYIGMALERHESHEGHLENSH
ncbi:MAG: F0F1 ATP synthase subunit A [Marinilabiliales bacterium]|nr:F0F1 ATP synthase subunit A [Marinilabiliales bacterium]